MKTAITTTLVLVTALALAPRAVAQPADCDGRYTINGELDLGDGIVVDSVTTARRVSIGGGDPGFTSSLNAGGRATCRAVLASQVARDDAFVVRTKYEGCGERPTFRVRLKFSDDCESVRGRVRAAGQLVARFEATRDRVNRLEPDDPSVGNPDDLEPPVVVIPDPTDPDPTDNITPIGSTPTISTFAPIAARVGDSISIFGSNLDRDTNGERWVGVTATSPYVLVFDGSGSPRNRTASPNFVSDTEITVTVPPAAASGTILLAVRRASGLAGVSIGEATRERVVIVREEAPVAQEVEDGGVRPASEERGTLTVQETELSPFEGGVFQATSPFQIGAFLDANDNNIVDLFTTGRNDVPYLAAPVRTSEFDFTIQGGRGYFQGANAMLWVFFEGGNPAILDNTDKFFVVHLSIDLANRTARPIAMQAGVAGSPGIVMLTDTFASETNISVAQPGAGVGAISGRIAAVPIFLETIFLPSQPGLCLPTEDICADFGPSIETRLWSNGIVIDFDVLLFTDSN